MSPSPTLQETPNRNHPTPEAKEMSEEWRSIDSAPEGTIVETKMDDERGCRNEQPLRRSGRLWFFPDGSMYVYYTPTHWRPCQ
jgi:hypothetical protein